MDKTFAVAGISTLDGVAKVRFAKDIARVKVLEKNGHTNINLIELPNPMTKVAAVQFLMSNSAFSDADSQTVLNEYTSEDAPSKMAEAIVHAASKTAKTKVAKTLDDVEKIRAKNLQTLKSVHSKVKARNAKEAEEANELIADIDDDMEFNIADITNRRKDLEDFDA